ncbi:hypothetical protein GCM10027566_00860 [Arachidicoccus ginsenosidivorans]|uniref:Rpn family recombination-promoting nuclease/putative transposase n=1 Tax=Arachidicoccus ginsenosidivorans TaxID=496057 RepID=A0A5B8VN08_9BACT|nr:hypothetical protein [Arachidicoccus ginsenosidivorans]QEC72563.1 hypothetical protein FSB73_13630 [Arachidicoccus ginsenosidivorans]
MMKKCHVINRQKERAYAELYSAKLQGREEGRVEIIEQLIDSSKLTLEEISRSLKIPLSQVEEIKANVEHAMP